MNSDARNPQIREPHGPSLWFGLALSGAAFAINGFLGFVISWRTCFIGHGQLGALSGEGVRWLLGGITAVLFVVAVFGWLHSYRNWRRVSKATNIAYADSSGTVEFVSVIGVLCSTFLGVGIIWFSIPLIFIDMCVRSH